MRPALSLALVAASGALAGCMFDDDADDRDQLQLVVDEEPLALVAPTSLLVQLLVLGDDGDAVTLSAPELPPFATLTGTRLLLAPTYADAGDYDVPLVATAGDRSDTETLRLHITRGNTGPMWQPVPRLEGSNLSLSGNPEVPAAVLIATICDEEGDAFTLDAEVVPSGTAFQRRVTHQASAVPTLKRGELGLCADLRLPFDDLVPGSYGIALHAVDELGAEDEVGWIVFGGFVVTP